MRYLNVSEIKYYAPLDYFARQKIQKMFIVT